MPNKKVGRIKIKCKHCEKTFEERKSRLKHSNRQFCSKKCYDTWKFSMPLSTKTKCKYCGKEISRFPFEIKKGTHIYCSTDCRDLAQQKRIQKTCKTCGKKFEVPICLERAIYCSMTCRSKDIEYLKKVGFFPNRISNAQRKLFKIIKEIFPTAVMEHGIRHDGKLHFLDIAVLEKKLNIEFDGIYYHPNPEEDRKRDELLSSLGWRVVRIKGIDEKSVIKENVLKVMSEITC